MGRVFSEIPRVQTMVSKTLSAPSVQIWDIQPKRCTSEMSNNHSLYKRCKFSISETRTRHLRSLDDQQSNLSQYITAPISIIIISLMTFNTTMVRKVACHLGVRFFEALTPLTYHELFFKFPGVIFKELKKQQKPLSLSFV